MKFTQVLMGLFAVVLWTPAHAGKPQVEVPSRGTALVETLPRGYGAISATTRPTSAKGSMQSAHSLFDAARRTGDARLATRSAAVLAALPASERESTSGLLLAAELAQHRHDFDTAIALLDKLLVREPMGATARQVRAQIHLVQGRIALARRDCASLMIRDTGASAACVAAVALRTGDFESARKLVDRVLATGVSDVGYRRYLLVLRGEIASRSGAAAEPWFDRALEIDPHDARTLSAYAAHLNRSGEHARVRRLLMGQTKTETLQLHDVRAARALGSPDALRATANLAQRFATTRALGGEPELRDEAELRLALGDVQGALRLARMNFETQRDYEDVDILLRAASAAGDAATLEPARAWAKREAIPLEAGR